MLLMVLVSAVAASEFHPEEGQKGVEKTGMSRQNYCEECCGLG